MDNDPRDRIDFSQYRQSSLDNYRMLFEPEMNFVENLDRIIREFVILPSADLQIPVFLSSVLSFTPICDILPVTFAIGAPGSGKSTLGMLASHIMDTEILNACATAASIRNHCQKARFGDDGTERSYLLIWDDLKSEFLIDNPITYALLRGGYNRKTDQVTIASQSGENLTFRVFGGRLLSSIEPFFNHPRLTELQRRTMPIVCKRFHNFTQQELLEAGFELESDYSIADKPDTSDFDWTGINNDYLAQWTLEAISVFANTRKKFSRSVLKKKMGKYFTISRDPICTGVALGIFEDLEHGVEHFCRYWQKIAEPQFSELTALAQIICSFIDERLQTQEELVMIGKVSSDSEVTINPSALKKRITLAQNEGELDIFATPKEIAAVMRSMGWELRSPDGIRTGHNSLEWVRVAK